MRSRTILRWVVVSAGVVAVGAAAFAPQLGLDSNQDWGPSRRLLLLAGVILIALTGIDGGLRAGRGAASRVAKSFSGSRTARVARRVLEVPRETRAFHEIRVAAGRWGTVVAGWVSRSPILTAVLGDRRRRVVAAAWAAFFLVAASYAWLASVGMWFKMPGTSDYHDMQAEAFLHGQAHLLVEPDARLLALANPYDPQARASVPHVWDASLYKGRYYLNWGPVPALLLTPVKAIAPIRVGDNLLTYVFLVGSIFWSTRILTRVWWDHLSEVPGWVVFASVLTIGWANPLPWMANTPWIYESAIAGGQFFLLMGISALYPTMSWKGGRARDLLWAGVALALAIGTRWTLVPAVVLVTGIVAVRIIAHKDVGPASRRSKDLAAFLLPLLFAGASLGAYNQARFGSPLETGQLYVLTSYDTQNLAAPLFSLGNTLPNLYNYLINPVRLLSVFPYIKPNWGGIGSSVLRIPVPEDYFSWQVSGLLIVAPFVLFCFSAASSLWRRRTVRATSAWDEGTSAGAPLWFTGTLLGIGLVEFVVIQMFHSATMRYHADFMPSLLLAAAIGLWHGLAARARQGRTYAGWAALGLILMVWTSLAGLLLGVTGAHSRFEALNPELFDRLTRFFTP